MAKMEDKQNLLILGAILIVGAVLRFVFPFEIPFTYDEFSALFRTHFSSFSELIEKGVKIDGHPAGIQVFLYYWTMLFGYSELVVKLPFIAAGLASIWLVYQIGRQWFNPTTGLVSAAFVATLQYTVMYSQIARPYISGMFFSLLMAFYWYKVIFEPGRKKIFNLVMFVFSGALCVYNHHFSLLMAAIIGLAGLLFIKRENLLQYIVAGLAILVLYLPHLPILLYQLNQGGVEGWLGKPQNNFILKYLDYCFHFSWYVFAMLILIVGLGVFTFKKESFRLKFLLISLCWLALPFLIGFFYSKYVNAVLQYSVLIFSFPFFLFLIFGHLPDLKFKPKLILVSGILIVTTLSLIFERQHYRFFYDSPFEQILVEQDKAKEKYGDRLVSVIDSHKKITDYYLNKSNLDSSFVSYENFDSIYAFVQFLKKQKTPYLYFGSHSGSHPLLVSVVLDYYPNLKWQKNYYGGFAYLFSKSEADSPQAPVFSSEMGYESQIEHWSQGKPGNYCDTFSFEGNFSYYVDSLHQWSNTFEIPLAEIISHTNNFIDASVWVYFPEKVEGFILASEIRTAEKSIDWRGTSSKKFTCPDDTCRWVKIHHCIKLSDIDLNYPGLILKVYVANMRHKSYFLDNFEIRVREGNPNIYALNQKIRKTE
ncbi:MAG: glycosyltransferase family 39 protein [Bacteroidales bacterium]|nr:glycosyltransferase family 39 protein [Bacteroidales bacterium]MCF8458090.1 glycosyltransferase family 39 protein [Bacteroidales bacterium]